MDADIHKDLIGLRERLRINALSSTGATDEICSDEILEVLERYRPRTMEELLSLDGITKEFATKYGMHFLYFLDKCAQTDMALKTYQMTENQVSIIKELEKNLIDISKRNRLLFISKSQQKFSEDLKSDFFDIRDLIFGKKKSVTICSRSKENPLEPGKYLSYVSVIKEATRAVRERGRNDLYIGYPFVRGLFPGEGFEVRAPLVMIPVKAEKTNEKISLRIDEDRDSVFNTTLLLAFFKFSNNRKTLPDPEFEDYTDADFMLRTLEFYSSQGMKILHDGSSELKQFVEYKPGTVSKYNQGEFHVENVVALGKFGSQANSIHRDYETMLESNEINGLLYNLIDAYNVDPYEEVFYKPSKPKTEKKHSVSENGMVYINSLNGSQENVLKQIENTSEIVIQGPPGTGKSQTIASLIIDFINKDKTVLMVSEKKTALDVVYSRLGVLSKYAIQIDDTSDKEFFYKQMDDLINIKPTEYVDTDLDSLSKRIDLEIERLEELSKTLYSSDEIGIEPYKLFHCDTRFDPNDDVQYGVYKQLGNFPGLTSMKFSDLSDSHQLFAGTDLLDRLMGYDAMTSGNNMFKSVKKDISAFDLRTMLDDANKVKEAMEKWKGKFILSKMKGKAEIEKEVSDFVDKYFVPEEKEKVAAHINEKGFDDVIYCVKNYDSYMLASSAYATLTEPQKMYLAAVFSIKDLFENSYKANDGLYDQIINWHIDNFRKKHISIFNTIEDFDNIVNRIRQLTEQKRELSIKHTEYFLFCNTYSNFNDMSKKSCKEIHRKIETKRKKSVNLFIKAFSAQLFKGIKIWLMTPEAVSEIIPFEKGRFDLVVFDEASQMFREKGLPAIYRAKKVVIAGDDKQLRPSAVGSGRFEISDDEDEDLDAALEETSLLDLAKSRYTPVLLDYHYRSKYEELINFSNYAFYRARLCISPNVTKPEVPPIQVHLVNGIWTEKENAEEAKKVVEVVKNILETRKNGETMGIITFNITQRDRIEQELEEECDRDRAFAAKYEQEITRKENGEDVGLFIKSIENVQGDERDVIIFSIAYAKDEEGHFKRQFGTLNQEGGENRLNVAITRARKSVQIVTSLRPTEFDVTGVTAKGPQYLRKYLDYCFAVSDGMNDLAKSILLSFHADERERSEADGKFENEVYSALTERGYAVDKGIGVGGYSIDFAVRNGDRYVLGIECDSSLYSSSESARERDFHRQNYLESRGWKVHRIWSTNWWLDKNKEIDKIVALLGGNPKLETPMAPEEAQL